MAISRDDLDQHGLIIGVSPERFRAVAMPLLFDHLNAQCEGTIAVNRQARIVWINDKYAEKVGIDDPRSVLGKEIEEVLPASRLREVVESGHQAAERGQPVLYVTERCVLQLTLDGLELIEVAPGVDIQRDILDRMDFTPIVRTPQLMDARLFLPPPIGLSELLNAD